MRIAVIDKEKCDPKQCGLECIKICPGVRMGQKTIEPDEKGFPKIAEELCTGCGLCVKKCPFSAITIINLPSELSEPTHQYGQNAFRIYGLPIPRAGITALVGPNGIGKSTILKILAGHLAPNLGNFLELPRQSGLPRQLEKSFIKKPGLGNYAQKEKYLENALKKFKGTEAAAYLGKTAAKKTIISYKPQDVTLLPRTFKGTVRQLLQEVSERKDVNQTAADFELGGILDKKLGEISGGELQRAAIAAACSKKADFYFFDEPSSFLDVSQRLKVARQIKKLGETTAVFVVEHDLAVLDYLADYVCVLFGKPGVFGAASGIKSARTGINEFLDGFLKAENTRIRDHAIRFEARPPADEWKGKKKSAYDAFEKKYPTGFRLEAEGAELRKGEVIGVLGPNAIGKTTFMKVLAGVEAPTHGDACLNVCVSYKPQYLETSFEGNVLALIDAEDLDREFFDSEVKRSVEDLFFKKVRELSGGELQRVAIAVALSKKADVCLLDEPSAFLDIEQRFLLAQLVKRVCEKKETTAIVVDHDVVFQDLVANRVLPFEGAPGVSGKAGKIVSMHDGMNQFLARMDVTMRRDKDNKRPRINKPGSQLDAAQRKSGEYYYEL